jgi:hypothetical protein
MISRRWLHRSMNLALTRVAAVSGIDRQYFNIEVEGSRDYAYHVTVSVAGTSRTYELNFGDHWAEQMAEDAQAGAFGPAQEPWLRTNVRGSVLQLAR